MRRLLTVCLIATALAGTVISPVLSQRVVGVSPTGDVVGVATDAVITITFDTKVDPASIGPDNVRVFGRWSGPVPGQLSLDAEQTTLVFTPDRPFFHGEWVSASVARSVLTAIGDSLQRSYAWGFWAVALPGRLEQQELARIDVRGPGDSHIQSYGAHAGDLDGDGWSDLSIPNEKTNDVRVFLNNGSGGYEGFQAYGLPGGSSPSPNDGADFNGDGFLDLAVGSAGNEMLTVMLGDGDGGFSDVKSHSTLAGVRGVCVADFDGDGLDDIFTANRIANAATIVMNAGGGLFSPAERLDTSETKETACAIADVDRDGIMDVFVAGLDSRRVLLLHGDGVGGFVAGASSRVAGEPWMLAAGDLNDDGIPDVVSANSSGHSVTALIMSADGQFVDSRTVQSGIFVLAVDLGDLDGDGDLDMVASNFGTADFTVYENDGLGNFSLAATLETTGAGSCAILHDRDNDGDLDITGIDELDDLVILFDNDATGVNVEDESPEASFTIEVFPQPADRFVRLRYASSSGGSFAIRVHDIAGREVGVIASGVVAPGAHTVMWDASRVAAGIYVARLEMGDRIVTSQIAIVR